MFNSDSSLVHFGLLDSVPALYGGGGVSYNFLHLTLQEFLAAYHITQLPDGIDVFKRHSKNHRWEVVWRFVSGLTEFQYFVDNVRCKAFRTQTIDHLKVENLLLHCLFEGQVKFNADSLMPNFGHSVLFSMQLSSSPLDIYALGYCIANSSSTTWKVQLMNGSGESFLWGLKSSHCRGGIISHLSLNVRNHCLREYPLSILRGISNLDISVVSSTAHLEQVIPLMTNLNSLSIPVGAFESSFKLLETISLQKNAINLSLQCPPRTISNSGFLAAVANLISSKSSLRALTVVHCMDRFDPDLKPLCDILFGPSSLRQVSLSPLPSLTETCFENLLSNTCLTSVHINNYIEAPLPIFAKILQRNSTVQKIHLQFEGAMFPDQLFNTVMKEVKKFNVALSKNTTLNQFVMEITLVPFPQLIIQGIIIFILYSLMPDSRVSIVHTPLPPGYEDIYQW